MDTEEVAEFICKTSFADIPDGAVDAAKRLILDFCGVAIAGSRELAATIVSEYIKDFAARCEAGVIGQGFRSEASLAALTNAIAGHTLDYDDYSLETWTHPTATILPGLLSLGEALAASGKAILEAYIIGIEVASKVGATLGPTQYERGWHCTGTIGTICSAAAAAKLLNLDRQKVKTCLGIASSLAGGLRQNFGTMTKALHAGRAAQNGVLAARLAEKEFSASVSALEGQFGFSRAFGNVKVIDNHIRFGTPVFLIDPGVRLKLYPSCGATHCGIEAALKLRSEHNISATDILEVELSTHPMLPEVAFSHEPETIEEAKVSAEYCVSRALINGNVLLSDFTPEAVMDPETQKLLRKVRFLPATDKKEKYNLATGVTVRMCDGKVYSKRIEIPKGAPENPLTSEELYGKFKACASSLLCANDVEKISILVSKLDQLMDIGELMYLLVQEDRATIYG